MNDNQQGEWPKSFLWHTAYCNEPDIVTFYCDEETVKDYCGCIWSYSDCISCNAWVPTDQHKAKPAPAPSQDYAKAKVADAIESARRYIKNSSDPYINDDGRVMYLRDAISELADAVERLAK